MVIYSFSSSTLPPPPPRQKKKKKKKKKTTIGIWGLITKKMGLQYEM